MAGPPPKPIWAEPRVRGGPDQSTSERCAMVLLGVVGLGIFLGRSSTRVALYFLIG
jgi:hypothetical protein